MVRVRVPVGVVGNGYGALFPSYSMVPGSWQPVVAGKVGPDGVPVGVLLNDPVIAQLTVLVDLPDEDCTNGQPDKAKIKARYPTHPLVTSGHFD